MSLSQVLPPELHENIPPLPAGSFSRLTFPQRRGPGIAHAVSTCKPENELSIFDGRATAAVKYGIYYGEMLPLFPARPPSATSAGGMDRTDYTGFKNGNGEKIITNRIGELVHIDCRQLSKGITPARPGRTYHHPGRLTVTVARRVEVVEDKKTLTVMFATLKAFNILKRQYGPEVEAVITGNGAEFGSGPAAKNKGNHPFECLLLEMAIKHRYTGPYRPQTDGKVERFWRTIKEDFIKDALYEDMDDLKNETNYLTFTIARAKLKAIRT